MGLFDLFRKAAAPRKTPGDKVIVGRGYTIIDHSDNLEAQIVPIEERVRTLRPIADGLYAHEILALSYAETYHPSGGDEYQGFWWWRYGVRDVRAMLESLRSRGFITEGDAATAVRSRTASELKEFLRAQGLRVGGRKADLVERVLTEADPSSVRRSFPHRTYALTDRGRAALEMNSAIVEAHKDPMRCIWDVPERELNRPRRTADERWGELNAAYVEQVASGDYGLARNTRLEMAEQVAAEGRYAYAIELLCSVMAFDLSETSGDSGPAAIPPGVIGLARGWQAKAGMGDEELQGLLLRGFARFGGDAPAAGLTPEECLEAFNGAAH